MNIYFIPKLFRVNYGGCDPLSIMKLNGKKIRWIIAQKLKGDSTSKIAEIPGSQLVEFSRSINNTLKPASFLKFARILGGHIKSYHSMKRI